MPVTVVSPQVDAGTRGAGALAGPAVPAADGFDRTLAVAQAARQPVEAAARTAAARRDPHGSPTVTLSQMLEYAASGRLQGAPLQAAVHARNTVDAAAQVTSAGDAWGRPSDRRSSAASGAGAQVLTAGERYLGVPYKWGGTSASSGFDCSGFVQQVYADVGIRLPRVSIDQSKQGTPVASVDQARPGDLVFWNGNGSRPNHIGIYAGEGRMLVAPSTGDVVRYQEITRTPHAIRRIIP